MLGGYVVQETLKSYEKNYSEETARHLDDMFLVMPAQQIFYIALLCAALAFLLGFFLFGGFDTLGHFLVGVAIASLAGGAAFIVPKQILRWLKLQRVKKFNIQLVDALATMSIPRMTIRCTPLIKSTG